MKYVVDDKKLNAATFIAFVNQVWQQRVACLVDLSAL